MNLAKLATMVTAIDVAVDAFDSATHAEELTGTLKKVEDTGTITLGIRDSSIPFSYNVGGVRATGCSYGVATEVTEDVKKQLGLKGLEVNEILIISQNRITLLQNGAIDLECGSITNNLERQRQALFTNTISIISTRIMAKKDSGIRDWADLKGRNVVTTAGTTSKHLLYKMNDEKQMSMNIISTKDRGQSFLTLELGRAVTSMMDGTLLYGGRAKTRNPAEWVVMAKPRLREAYGCMVRKDDKPPKTLADRTIAGMMKGGMINAEYKKWFGQPAPPKGVNMEFSLSGDMKALIKNPNDKTLD